MALPRVIVIVGPTASGKTALGIQLATALQGAVVSADSRQVYAGFNIGTAKPKEAWLEEAHSAAKPDLVSGVPHYLMSVASPIELYSLAHWQKAAYRVLVQLVTQQILPLIVGGSMLYVDSVLYNYDIPIVAPNPGLRAQLERQSISDLYTELLRKDVAAHAFIQPHNQRRIIRALEVMQSTGKPFSQLRQKRLPRFSYRIIGIFSNWENVERAITNRARHMIRDGLAAERAGLAQRYGNELPLLKTMNYAQVPDVNGMIQANMRYARRQMSWWKRNPHIQWFASGEKALTSLADDYQTKSPQ